MAPRGRDKRCHRARPGVRGHRDRGHQATIVDGLGGTPKHGGSGITVRGHIADVGDGPLVNLWHLTSRCLTQVVLGSDLGK